MIKSYSWSSMIFGVCSLQYFQAILFLEVFLHACADQHSPGNAGGPSADLQSSHCVALQYFALKFQIPWPPHTLNSISLIWGDCQVGPGVSVSALWSGDSYQVGSGGNEGTRSICFSSLRDHCPLLPCVQCLENFCFIDFVLFSGCPGRRVNLVSVTPQWLEVFLR